MVRNVRNRKIVRNRIFLEMLEIGILLVIELEIELVILLVRK
jgi:hypothetical protein